MRSFFKKFSLAKLSFIFFFMGIFLASLIFLLQIDGYIINSSPTNPEIFDAIGSYVGGIAGTFFTGAAFLLVYLTYKSQEKELSETRELVRIQNSYIENQTKLMTTDGQLKLINDAFNSISEDIESLSFNGNKGLEALYHFDNSYKEIPNSVLNHLNSIFASFNYLFLFIEDLPNENHKLKDSILTRANFYFYSKILWPTYHNVYDKFRWEIKEKQPGGNKLIDIYEKLTVQTLFYLKEKELIEWPTWSKSLNEIINNESRKRLEANNKLK